MDKQEYELRFEDIVRLSCGVDDTSTPRSFASLYLDEIRDLHSEDGIVNKQLIQLKNAVLNIFMAGGCVVVQVDFPKSNKREFNQCLDLCAEWCNPNSYADSEFQYACGLIVLPSLLEGELGILFSDMVYFTNVPLPDTLRLVMCFDNGATTVIEDEEVNYEELLNQAISEVKSEEDKLDREIDEMQKEIDEINQSQNIYQQRSHGMRFSSDDGE